MTSDNRGARIFSFSMPKSEQVCSMNMSYSTKVDPLPSRQLALLVLSLNPLDSSTKQSLLSLFLNVLFHSQSLLGTCAKVCKKFKGCKITQA